MRHTAVITTLLAVVAHATSDVQDKLLDRSLKLRHDSTMQRDQDSTMVAKSANQDQNHPTGALPWNTACESCKCHEQHCKWNTFTSCCQFCCASHELKMPANEIRAAATAPSAVTFSIVAAAALVGLAAGSAFTLALLRRRNAAPAGYEPLLIG
jgi:hypothetical protein